MVEESTAVIEEERSGLLLLVTRFVDSALSQGRLSDRFTLKQIEQDGITNRVNRQELVAAGMPEKIVEVFEEVLRKEGRTNYKIDKRRQESGKR